LVGKRIAIVQPRPLLQITLGSLAKPAAIGVLNGSAPSMVNRPGLAVVLRVIALAGRPVIFA
jgi:hypothetical protein